MPFLAVSVVAFVFGFVGSLPMAGPVALLCVSNGVKRRYGEALRIALGAAAAEGIYAFLAFWGFATFLARHALVLPISHGVTAVVLCGLGARFLFFKLKEGDERRETEAKPGRFWVGFCVAGLYPTLLATWGAVTTFLYSRQFVRFTGLLAIPFGIFAAAGIAAWGFTMVALLKRFRDDLPRATLTWVVRAMGVLLVGVGVWSAVELGEYIAHPRARARASHAGDDDCNAKQSPDPGAILVDDEARLANRS
jgi:threonine/homoserine/homoserine lactone efflux protein